MKLKFLFCLTLLAFLNCGAFHGSFIIEQDRSRIKPIVFTENKGQVHDQHYNARPDVLFGVQTGNLVMHLRNTGVSYQLSSIDSSSEPLDDGTKQKKSEAAKHSLYRIDLEWVNANKNFTQSTDETFSGSVNYYLQSCPNGVLNVKSYCGVTLHNIYKGINLHYYEKKGELKHDYIIAPHAGYKQIQLKIDGASVKINKDGSLLLVTPLGNIQEGAPIVFQNNRQLKAKWIVKNNILSFEIANYDPDRELIIDPITRIWGTYYGGNGDDVSNSSATDPSGNFIVAGRTSTGTGTIIATSGSHQTVYGAGLADGYLAKFDASGARVWATYYGGNNQEEATAVCVNTTGDIYVTGTTQSTIGIATPLSHQSSPGYSATTADAFLVKFDNNGVRIWGTYYGGGGAELGSACAVDPSGNIYFTGRSSTGTTGTIIATSGSHQPTNLGGAYDGFLAKFDANGNRLWATYYGGNMSDEATGCAIDASGNIFMSGYTATTASTFIATAGSQQPAHGGFGSNDAFLVKFNSNGVRQWGTYYGGNGQDYGHSCSTDPSGNVFLSGSTTALTNTVIATTGSHQSSLASSNGDAFLVKFNTNGLRLWGTYYGDAAVDAAASCNTDALGNIYLTGYTFYTGNNVFATLNGHQFNNAGGSDGFLAIFNTSGVRQWGTYYGGTTSDYATSCSVASNGNIYLTGYTNSNSSAVFCSGGCFQPLWGGGGYDTFLASFKDCMPLNPSASVTSTICSGANIIFTASVSGTVTPAYSWAGPNAYTAAAQNPTLLNASVLNSGIYTLTVNNNGCTETATVATTVNATPTISVNSGSICSGDNFTITPVGAATFTIQGGNAVVSPVTNTNFTVAGTSTAGCVSSLVTSSVLVNSNPTISVNSGSVCAGNTFTFNPSGAMSYTLNDGVNLPTAFNSSISTVPPIGSTNYTVTGANSFGCKNTVVTSVTAVTLPNVNAMSTLSLICVGQSINLTASGAITYTWNAQGTGSTIAVSPSVTTTYTVTGMAANGCTNTAVITQSVSACTGVGFKSNVDRYDIKLYPNPGSGIFIIELPSAAGITITDMSGRIIFNENSFSFKHIINIEKEAKGVYLLSVKTNEHLEVIRLIKE